MNVISIRPVHRLILVMKQAAFVMERKPAFLTRLKKNEGRTILSKSKLLCILMLLVIVVEIFFNHKQRVRMERGPDFNNQPWKRDDQNSGPNSPTLGLVQNIQQTNWVDDLRSIASKNPAITEGLVIDTIFSHIKPKNRHFCEFGFGYSGSNKSSAKFINAVMYTKSYHLNQTGWSGWFFDAVHGFEEFNIYKERLSPDNIVKVFEKYRIPENIDFLCIDVDSIDIWLLQAVLKKYRPTLINIEFNLHFPYESTITCDQIWEPWRHDVVYGTSIGAILSLAKKIGYVPVYVQFRRHRDVFLVEKRELENSGGKALTIDDMKRFYPLPRRLHGLGQKTRVHRFIDFDIFSESGDEVKARQKALSDVRQLNETYFS